MSLLICKGEKARCDAACVLEPTTERRWGTGGQTKPSGFPPRTEYGQKNQYNFPSVPVPPHRGKFVAVQFVGAGLGVNGYKVAQIFWLNAWLNVALIN
jgi:hypothetical protein